VVGISFSVRTAPTTPDPADTVVTTHDEVTRYLAAHVPAPVRRRGTAGFYPHRRVYPVRRIHRTLHLGGFWANLAAVRERPAQRHYKRRIPARSQRTATAQSGVPRAVGRRRSDRWNFHASLREQFNYSRYPLGRHQIKPRMWHPDYARNVYLTPDFGAYASTDRAAMPGVDPDLVLETGTFSKHSSVIAPIATIPILAVRIT
jgi:hypothetical protein